MKKIQYIILVIAFFTIAVNAQENQSVILPTYNVKSSMFNSTYADFGPAYGRNKELYFTSERDTGTIANRRYKIKGKYHPYLQLFVKNEHDSIKIVKISGGVNTKFNESTPVVTSDGKTMYFTRNSYIKKDKKSKLLLKIFKTNYTKGSGWDKAVELPFNSNTYSVSHPALSSNNKWLYFASDMPGTHGKSDIFKIAIHENGSFGSPENLGPSINTSESDTFPFVDKNENLYFASNGHPGKGGLDLFISIFDHNFDTVYNLGESINSTADDFAMIFNLEKGTGYFSSNREGGMGDDDIYKLKQLTPLIIPCNGKLSGVIRDDITHDPLPFASVKIVDENNIEIADITADGKGYYSIDIDCNKTKFIATASMEKYNSHTKEVFATKIITNIIEGFDLTLKKIEIGQDLAKELKIKPIYFDLAKWDIREDATVELQKVITYMKRYPDVIIEVRSHSDARGKDSYNLALSDKRAKTTANYISEVGGISVSRIKGKGFGEKQLLNKCDDGVKCSEEEHQFNRRSEFISVQE